MSGKLTYGISLIFGILSFVLLVTDVTMINSNRHLQDSANQRQADINKGSSLGSLNQGLIQALAEAAINSNDAAAKELLAGQGITLNNNAAKASSATAAAAKSPAARK